ncbi:MAG: DinB family protein [Anaerolineales bacterium]|nr:DinB family protein [Anaerolineales bacterium]
MEQLLNEFKNTVIEAAGRLKLIPESKTGVHPSDGEWSIKEILGHLVDSAANNHRRFVQYQFVDELVFSGYRQQDWVRVQHYYKASWLLLVELWQAYNLHLVHLLSVIPERIFEQPNEPAFDEIGWDWNETGLPSLAYLARDYIKHMNHHLQDIWDRV